MSESSNHKKELRKLRILRTTRWFLSAIGLVIIAVGIYFAIDLFLNFKSNEVTNDAQVEQYVSPINVKVPGYIHKIYFTEHQFVKKGDRRSRIPNKAKRSRSIFARCNGRFTSYRCQCKYIEK
jgi:membrane fusion protein (multidrug efflux system)